ncbi:MAG TPA: GatB/YqeY domain-containing protein [Acidobacteriota bacterium]|nr:GatB/YqeY domain-containing protein [Acidobacteriota bacterium]
MLDQIKSQMTKAMKDKDEIRTSVLRMLISDFKYAQIEKRAPLDENDSLRVIQSAIKKRKEAIEMYEKGGRPELAAKETAELKILEEFAPSQMDEKTATVKIVEVINELGAKDKKDLGRVIKEVLSRYKGQIDGKLAQKIIAEKLS